MRILVTAVIAASLASGCTPADGRPSTAAPAQAHPAFAVGPYILPMADGAMAIVVQTDDASEPVVEWWRGDTDTTPTTIAASKRHNVWVAMLPAQPAGTVVAYRVTASTAKTVAQKFVTPPDRQKSFQFAAFGDTRTGHGVHKAIVAAMTRSKADFVVHTGDMVDRGGSMSQWHQFFEIERPLLATRPIIAAVGNHDASTQNHYRNFFLSELMNDNDRFFTTDWGNLRIVSLDPMEACVDGCPQLRFIERTLEEAATRDMLIMLVVHYPPYSSGAHGSSMAVRQMIGPLAKRYGVELVISGHDHNYERTHAIDGVTYVVTGSAGAPERSVSPQSFTAAARTEPHYILFTVDDSGIHLEAINLGGDTFDVAHIPPVAPQPSNRATK